MPTIIDGTYEQFNDAAFDSVYYMDPADGRTDTFQIFGLLSGGAVFRCQLEAMPQRFNQDYPQATKVDMFTIS